MGAACRQPWLRLVAVRACQRGSLAALMPSTCPALPCMCNAMHCIAIMAWPALLLPQDWLFISYKRVDGVEYALLLVTFGLVLAAGLEAGIAGGILLAALHFAYRCAGVGAAVARTLFTLALREGCCGVEFLTSP